MAAIFPQVRGNAVSAGFDREMRRAQRIGMTAPTRVPDGRDMIDIDAEALQGRMGVRHGDSIQVVGVLIQY